MNTTVEEIAALIKPTYDAAKAAAERVKVGEEFLGSFLEWRKSGLPEITKSLFSTVYAALLPGSVTVNEHCIIIKVTPK